MKPLPLMLLSPAGLSLLLLAGCQVVPDRLPQAEPPPAASCYFASPLVESDQTSAATLRRIVGVLEAWGFRLDGSDTHLGLISASRERDLIGYYDPYDSAFGYARGVSVFGGIGVGGGSSIGLGFGGGMRYQPVEVERVSLLASDEHIRVARDIRRFDHLGDMRESYSASNDDFCQRLQTALENPVQQGVR